MHKTILLFAISLSLNYGIYAQLNLHPPTDKEKRILRNRVLNHTDHGYLGFETGVLLGIGPTRILSPNGKQYLRRQAAASGLENFKFFAGYAFRSHFFELAYGGGPSVDIFLYNPYIYNTWMWRRILYGSLRARYYWKIPLQSYLLKVLVGPEIGFGYRWEKALFEPNYSDCDVITWFLDNDFNGIAGINFRMDLKLKKNFTFFTRTNLCFAFPNLLVFRTS
jgi:hypothetical protein